MKKVIVTVASICIILGLAGLATEGKATNSKIFRGFIPPGQAKKYSKQNDTTQDNPEISDPSQDNLEVSDPPQDNPEANDPPQDTEEANDPPQDTAEVNYPQQETAEVNYPPLSFDGSCEWPAEGNSFDIEESVPGYLSATWSAIEDVGQNQYTGFAKFKVFDVAIKDGSTTDVVVDIELRPMDLESEPWTDLNPQEKSMMFAYEDNGSTCISPTSCEANLDDIHGAIHLGLIEKHPAGYIIEGDVTFLGVFVKAMGRQDDAQEICGFFEVPEEIDTPQEAVAEENDASQDSPAVNDPPQEITEVADQSDTDGNDTPGADDSVVTGGDNISGEYDPKGLLLLSEDFESGGWDASMLAPNWCQFDYSCQIVESPTGDGKVLKNEYKVENCNKSNRATMGDQLASRTLDYDEIWIGMKYYFDSDTFGPDSWPMVLFGTHALPDLDLGENWRSGPFSFWYSSYSKDHVGDLVVYYRGSKEQVTPIGSNGQPAYTTEERISIGPPALNAWNSFVVHIVWDATGDSGLLEVWHDGKLHQWKNINIGYNDVRAPYLKFGQYNWECQSDDPIRVSYTDNVAISVGPDASYCDVVQPGSILPDGIQCQ